MLRICSAMRTWQILMSHSPSDGVVVAAGGVGGGVGRSACRLPRTTSCAVWQFGSIGLGACGKGVSSMSCLKTRAWKTLACGM